MRKRSLTFHGKRSPSNVLYKRKPMIPKPHRRDTSLTPAQFFSAGYRDGLAHRPPHPQFQHQPNYLQGYTQGISSPPTPSQPSESIPHTPAPLTTCFSWSDLDGALRSIRRWEDDQARLGFGTVALGFNNGWWLVLLSEDLYGAVLPF